MISKVIANLRRDYSSKKLSAADVNRDPIVQFEHWFQEALDSEIVDATSMTLSTVSPKGRPSARVVLLKGIESNGFVFFTNYNSEKGKHMEHVPFASLTFYWKELDRQVRVEGKVEKISSDASAEYFKTRPWKSRIGAWVSHQSQPIPSRFHLMRKFAIKAGQLMGQEVPLPDFWGGYILKPDRMEFWQGRPSRLHDRINYRLEGENWEITRLSP